MTTIDTPMCPRCGDIETRKAYLSIYSYGANNRLLWHGFALNCATCDLTVWPPEAVAYCKPVTEDDRLAWNNSAEVTP